MRFIGASNYTDWRLEEARGIAESNGWSVYCCVQNHYTYLKPLSGQTFGQWMRTDGSMLDYCKSRSITPLAHSSLLWGAYARTDRPLWEKYAGEHNSKRLSVLKKVASQLGATPNQVVIAWMIQNDPAVIPVVGASSPEQLEENLQATSVELSVEQLHRLNKA